MLWREQAYKNNVENFTFVVTLGPRVNGTLPMSKPMERIRASFRNIFHVPVSTPGYIRDNPVDIQASTHANKYMCHSPQKGILHA